MTDVSIVIPCYNEAARLPVDAFVDHAKSHPECDFVFVDDGSRDSTLALIRGLEQRDPQHFRAIHQPSNQGKAEAVRVGMQSAFEAGARLAGYWDADLATPLSEIARMQRVLEREPSIEIVFGSRVQLLGREIRRSVLRHYLGRIFATAASVSLGLPVYDTQCGAKLFRVDATTRALFAEPFSSRWVFDVELIARLIAARRGSDLPAAIDVIYELPLERWIDVPGSKVRPTDFLRALFEMWRIHRRYLASGRTTGTA